MSVIDVVTILGTVVAILGTVVGATVYITRMIAAVNEKKLQMENETLSRNLAHLEANLKDVSEKISVIQKQGSAALVKKMEIDSEVALAKKMLGVAACSILVPYPFSSEEEFVFLSIDSDAADKLKRTRIPRNKGIAGYVYNSGRPQISGNVQRDNHFYGKVDARSGFKTENILCLPLVNGDEVIGVINFLNKITNNNFDEGDLAIAGKVAQNIAPKVFSFCINQDYFDILGLSSNKDAREASVVITDLSGSAQLTSSMSMLVVEDLFNEYFEKTIEIGFRYGGVVDKYMGDGFIMHFNISRPIKDHRMAALKASIEMTQEFAKLRQSWINYGFPVSKLYHRVAVESGDVYEVLLGHPQYRQATLLGEALIAASNLSDAAVRAKDLIVIGQNIHKSVSDKIITRPIPEDQLGKAGALITSAYELVSLKDANTVYNY